MKITAKDIPSTTGRGNWTDAITFGVYSVRVNVERDDCMGEPWKEHDGHGPVSEWRRMESKSAGERVLCQDRSQARFYDFAAAVKIARKDGWGFSGMGEWNSKKKKFVYSPEALKMSPGERAAKAAESDFDRLRCWCAGDWYWISIGVEVSRAGRVLDTDYCGGIESDGDYWREHAAEVAQGIISATRKETRERRYWEARDVITQGAQ